MGLFDFVFLISSVICLVHSSAIPMWEFLSRDEKMSYLYSTFVNQVENYCEFSDMQNCNKELIKYGLGKLSSMPNDHLDRMDPYQRGGHNIIWDSMMEGHEVMEEKTTRKPSGLNARPQSVSTNSNLNRRSSPQNNQATKSESKQQPANNIQEQIQSALNENNRHTILMDKYYANPNSVPYPENNYLNSAASERFEEMVPPTFILPSDYSASATHVGPMVVRVKPDGTLVDRKMSVDEDLIQFKMMKQPTPTLSNFDKFVGNLKPKNSKN